MTRRLTAALVGAATVTALASATPAHASPAPKLAEAGQAACAAGYSVRQVGDLGGSKSWASAITSNGLVAGTARTTASLRPQLPWMERNGNVTTLDVPIGSTFGRVMDANERGQAVGEVFTASPEVSQAALWQRDGSLTVLAERGVANAINARGDVVGLRTTDAGAEAVLWGKRGATTLAHLSDAEGASSRPLALDDNGTIVGSSKVFTEEEGHEGHAHGPRALDHATLWTKKGSPVDLGALDEHGSSRATAIAGRYVVGEANLDDGSWRATTFTADGVKTLADAGWKFATASGVNASGTVVGYGSKFYGNPSFGGAAIAWCGGASVDLGVVSALPAGWKLQSANAINDRGQIAATATTADNRTVAVVLTPTR